MGASAVHQSARAPGASARSAIAGLSVFECERDARLVAIPRPEVQLVVRFGPSANSGIDLHALGARPRAHRKLIRAGQRAVTARLHLGSAEAVLGVTAAAVAGRIVALEDLWGGSATRRMTDRLAAARDTAQAAAILEAAIAERLSPIGDGGARGKLVMEAANRLTSADVNAVADDLGMSERHLRRLFRETVGLSPKAFAKLMRFHRALRAAQVQRGASWASIAAATGYYDQAHLIAEFRAIAGATPRALIGELLGERVLDGAHGSRDPSNRLTTSAPYNRSARSA